jgi:hypothetical protein
MLPSSPWQPWHVSEEYSGMLDCAWKTVAQHGPQGLYRGALPLILGSSGKQAARWTGYETAANAMKDGGRRGWAWMGGTGCQEWLEDIG